MYATTTDVIRGQAWWAVEPADALAWLRTLPDQCVSLVFTSPPYEDARTYGIGFSRKGQEWVDWLRPIIVECARVSAGLVCVNMSAKVQDYRYSAAVEWLVADLTRQDGLVCGPAPHAWVKSEDFDDAPGNGTPGSGGSRYQRRDWEPVYSFCLPDRLPLAWTNNTAFGRPPKYGPGGEFSNRDKSGNRVNDSKKPHTKRQPTLDGDIMRIQHYAPPAVSNPGNVINHVPRQHLASDILRVAVGGGKLGCPIAHAGEAPMSLNVAERFVCWYARPYSIVLDPFAGTGTTAHAARIHHRRFIGCDERQSQIELTRKRMATVEATLVDPGSAAS